MGLNKPVDFSTAKLLKEKGYNEPCALLYDENGKISGTKMSMAGHPNIYINKYSAPTIADVVMWLYEKHKIWVSIGGDCDYKFKFEIHTWKWYEPEKSYRLGLTVLGETFWDTASKDYASPTEAYEAAIEYTLNHLI